MTTKAKHWDYYEECKTNTKYDKKAKCILCSKIISYSSTSHNLKIHLTRLHSEELGITGQQKRKPTVLWDYFTKTDEENKLATCNLCSKELCSNNTENLKSHLRRIHSEAYDRLCANIPLESMEEDDEPFFEEYIEDQDDEELVVDESCSSSKGVMSFFTNEAGDRARCKICRCLLRNKYRILRCHVRETHPKLFLELPDGSDNENEFTEVIYLEDEAFNKILKNENQEPIRNNGYLKSPDGRSKRQIRTTRRKTPTTLTTTVDNCLNEIDHFGAYITCLLKTVPKDTATKLQLEIINLIMNAKINVNSTPVVRIVVENGRNDVSHGNIVDSNIQITSNVAEVTDNDIVSNSMTGLNNDNVCSNTNVDNM